MNRIFGLDAARALAISLVMLAHLHQGSQEIGIYGVELFFALSGFLIGSILYRCLPENGKGRWTWKGMTNFWQRRWWRTLPAFYLFLLVAIAHHSLRGELPQSGWSGVLPYFLFLPNLMSPNEPFFDVSWSLCVEEAFYLLFPLVLLLFHRITESRPMAFAIAIAFFLLASLALREIAFAARPAAQVRVITLPRLDAIAFGVAMAVLVQLRNFGQKARFTLAAVGACLIMLSAGFHLAQRPIQEATGFFRFALIAMPFGFALCMPLLETWNRLPSFGERFRKPITLLSVWSYSIYLCHHMTMMAIYPLFGEWREHFAVKLLTKVVAVAVILGLSRFVYRHFESRFTRKRPPEIHDAAPSRKARLPSVPAMVEKASATPR